VKKTAKKGQISSSQKQTQRILVLNKKPYRIGFKTTRGWRSQATHTPPYPARNSRKQVAVVQLYTKAKNVTKTPKNNQDFKQPEANTAYRRVDEDSLPLLN